MNTTLRMVSAALLLFAGVGLASAQDWADISPPEFVTPSGSWGSSTRDYDGDGDPDLFMGSTGSGTNLLLRNDGDLDSDGTLDFADVSSGTPVESAFAFSHQWMDVDDDGDLDLLTNGSSSARRLLRNDGASFVAITPPAFNVVGSGGGLCLADFDVDGDLDIYMAVEGGSNQLYRNDGKSGGAVLYAQVTTPPLAMSTDTSEGAAWADYDNDGDPDLFVCGFNGTNRMFRNDGGVFLEVTAQIGPPADTSPDVGAAWGDYDDDGDLDLYVTGWSSTANALYRNDGDNDASGVPEFVDVSSGGAAAAAGFHLCAEWLDFDLDGDLDLFCPDTGGPAFLLRNDGDPDADGIPNFGDATTTALADSASGSHGTGSADVDGDGDPDILLARQGQSDKLFRNDQATGNNWLQVVLRGNVTGTQGITARVAMTAGGVTRHREVAGGGTYGSSGDSRIEFGLGAATSASEIQVRWASGQTTNVMNIPANQVVEIQEPGFGPNISAYAPNQAFTFQVPVGGAPVDAMTLFFRIGGEGAAFQSAPMFPAGGGQFFEVGVPQGFAAEDGLEGFIEYTMNGGSTQLSPFPGIVAPGFLPAALPNQVLPELPAPSQYVMYGLPFVPMNGAPGAVLEDDLGAYDPKIWRSFHFDPLAGSNGTYQEHPGTEPFAPGLGYWLIMKTPVAVGSPGFSTNTVQGTELLIQRGWNQIAHPYRFPVAVANVDSSAAPDVEMVFHEWDGTAYVTDNELEAWEGYFIFNAAAAAQPIVIPGVTSTAAAPAPAPATTQDGWRLAFSARQGSTRDPGNEIGVSRSATDEPDRLDRHAPPVPPGAVRAYFEQVAADGVPHELNRDLRSGREGTWDFVVEAPGEVGARIQIEGIEDLPSELEAVLIPLDTWAAIDLRERSVVDVPGGQTHRFRVVVGSGSYVQDVRSGATEVALEFALGLGYPNPLSTSTKIGFALPTDSNVQLAVYDVTGRKVRTLVNGTRSAGRHVAEWNAADEAGRSVAPGVYFVKIRAGAREETRKLTVLR